MGNQSFFAPMYFTKILRKCKGFVAACRNQSLKEGIAIKIIDITRSLLTAPLYPGSAKPTLDLVATRAEAGFDETVLRASVHTATHADAPSHYLSQAQDITKMPLSHYIGACYVLPVAEKRVSESVLQGKVPKGCQRILLKGGGDSYFTEDGAKYLVKQRVQTVGTDAWSVGPLDNEAAIHEIFLHQPVAILENLDLALVEEGWYFLAALPLKLDGCEGAWVRAVLLADFAAEEKH